MSTEAPSTPPPPTIPAMVGEAITRPPKTPPVPPGTFLPGAAGAAEASNARSSAARAMAAAAFGMDGGGEMMSRSNSEAGAGGGGGGGSGGVGLGLSTAAPGGAGGKKNRKSKEEEPAQLPLMQASWGMPPSLYVKAPTSSWAKTDTSLFVTRAQADVEDPDYDSDPDPASDPGDDDDDDEEDEEGPERKRPRKGNPAQGNQQAIRARSAYPKTGTLQRRQEALQAAFTSKKKKEEANGNGVSALDTENVVTGGKKPQPQREWAERPQPWEVAEKVIVIHPGSRFLRIGRSTDSTPIHVPNAIYRKKPKPAAPAPPADTEGVVDNKEAEAKAERKMQFQEPDRLDELIVVMREEMRQRMKANKLKLPPGKADAPSHLAARYNQGQKPIEHPVERDPYGWEWVEDYTPDVLFPGPDLHLAEDAPYELRHPIKRRDFNTDDYDVNQPQAVLSDQQEVLEHALGLLKKPVARKDYWRHSVVLVHPDHTNKPYLHLWGQLLIQTMGFREIGFLAESVCATVGAGLSSACVVDIGATRTTVACVDDGLLLNETRFLLDYGADDITKFYHHLLLRISFPHPLDLSSRLGWDIMDELKQLGVTLVDSYVASNLWKCFVREKGKPTKEYQYQIYDQPLLAPSSLFDPRAFKWEAKPFQPERRFLENDPDQMVDMKDDGVTAAMELSVQHLRPPPPAPPPAPAPAPAATTTTTTTTTTPEAVAATAPPAAADGSAEADAQPVTETKTATEVKPTSEAKSASETKPAGETKPPATEPTKSSPVPDATPAAEPIPDIDVMAESRKTPLDMAIACALIAAKDKGPGIADAILVLGGTSLMEGLQAALQERVAAQCNYRSLIPLKPATLPPPRGLEERIVTWRGAGVYSRLESMTEFWIKRQEWMDIGIKSYRNRMY